MRTPGFTPAVCATHRRKSSGWLGSVPAAMLRRLPTCVRSGPIRRRPESAHRMARAAAVAEQQLLTALGRLPGGRLRRPRLMREPAVELLPLRNRDVERPSAREKSRNTRRRRREKSRSLSDSKRAASPVRNHVHLAAERGNPERVDDIGAFQSELYRLAYWKANLVCNVTSPPPGGRASSHATTTAHRSRLSSSSLKGRGEEQKMGAKP